MSSFPPSVADFKAQFNRDFTYGTGMNTVMDSDVQRGLNEARIVFNPELWGTDYEKNTAYLYASAHFMVLNIQAAGGPSATNFGRGVQSKGGGTIESKGVGSVNVGYAVPDFVRQSPILSQFMRTDYGQMYLQFMNPRLVGNIAVVSGQEPQSFAGRPLPLSIVTTTLDDGAVGIAYSQALAASGGVSPLQWTVTDGSLPTGLALGLYSGAITGTPTGAGTSYFEVTVTDGLGVEAVMNYQVVVTL